MKYNITNLIPKEEPEPAILWEPMDVTIEESEFQENPVSLTNKLNSPSEKKESKEPVSTHFIQQTFKEQGSLME